MDVNEELLQLEEFFLTSAKPLVFNPYETSNVLRTSELTFEEICTTMQEQGVTDPKKLTEYEFYSKLSFYEKKFKNGNR
jgi:hypothetical protein